jgi:hypothetical protein
MHIELYMRLPQELIDRILLMNGWWFAYASGICSNIKHPKKRTIRSAIRHQTLIGFDEQYLYDQDINYLVRAYSKNREFVQKVMSEYNVTYQQMELHAYDDDIYTFFEDVDISDVKGMNRIVKNCIRHGAYVTFEKFVRRGYVISRTCLFRLVAYSHPLPYIQVLCDSGFVFDDLLIAPLVKRRQIASLAYIVHRNRLEPQLLEKYVLLQELLFLDPECTGYMWRSDIESIKYALPNTWKKFNFVLDPEQNRNMSVIDFTQHPRIFANFCCFMVTNEDYEGLDTMCPGNIFHRLMRLANCKGLFNPNNTQMGNRQRYYNFVGLSRSLDNGLGTEVYIDMWDFFSRGVGYRFLHDWIENNDKISLMSFNLIEFCSSLGYPGLYEYNTGFRRTYPNV